MAQENARKEQESKDRINLDKMKTMMNQSTDTQKLQQNEDLAKLRASTSLEKTVLAAQLKNRFQN
jgi:DNA primase large subunit